MSKIKAAPQELSLTYRILVPLSLAISTLLTYLPSLHYPFQFDDIANIQKHFYIRHHGFWSLWFSGSRWIVYWLNALHYSIGKFDPFSYRVQTYSSTRPTAYSFFLFCYLHYCIARANRFSNGMPLRLVQSQAHFFYSTLFKHKRYLMFAKANLRASLA